MFSLEQYQAVRAGAGLLDRHARGRLRLSGNDRRNYLQGLLTNDVAALGPGQGCYAALLTAQGRMTSDMRVSELGDSILIDLPGVTADAVRQRLSDFIFSEDVEVADVRDMLSHCGVYGPRAADIVATAVGAAPERQEQLAQMAVNASAPLTFEGDELIAIRSDDFGESGFELFVGAGSREALAEVLRAEGAVDVTAETMNVFRVEAGRPEFGVDMDDHTIPLEAGIEDRAISLTKGCYVGQEIIIRVLHRGHGRVAKRLVGLVAAPGDGTLERGERLLDREGVKDVGVVTSAVVSPRLGRPVGLGYVQRDYAEPGTDLVLAVRPGVPRRHVTVTRTPFRLPAAG